MYFSCHLAQCAFSSRSRNFHINLPRKWWWWRRLEYESRRSFCSHYQLFLSPCSSQADRKTGSAKSRASWRSHVPELWQQSACWRNFGTSWIHSPCRVRADELPFRALIPDWQGIFRNFNDSCYKVPLYLSSRHLNMFVRKPSSSFFCLIDWKERTPAPRADE